MEQTQIKYEIGGKTYVQGKLVLGQVRQLVRHLAGLVFPAEAAFDIWSVIDAVGDKLPGALAIVLTEAGQNPRDKDIAALAAEMEFTITAETTVKVVEDFFTLNRLSFLLAAAKNLIGAMEQEIPPAKTGSESLSASSPPATSQEGTPSSGAMPLTSADPTPDIVPGPSSSGKPC